MGLQQVVVDPAAIGIHETEVQLGHGIPLLSRLTVPQGCQSVILWHTLAAVVVEGAKHALGTTLSVFGCCTEPLRRLGVILRNPFALKIHEAKRELRVSIALSG